MATTDIIQAKIFEDGSADCMARITGGDGSNIMQSDVTSIAFAVFDTHGATPDTAISSGTVTVADDVFDTLQTDSRWSLDATGYNFRHDHGATVFPTGGHVYQVEYKFTSSETPAKVYWVVFELDAVKVRTS